MTKITEYQKLSKKAKRRLDLKKRRDWNGINPVSRTSESQRVYRRHRVKAQLRREEY